QCFTNMDAETFLNRDDSSTSTTNPHIPNGTELTCRYDSSTSSTNPHIPNGIELTCRYEIHDSDDSPNTKIPSISNGAETIFENKNHENDIKNNHIDNISVISEHPVYDQIYKSKQSDYQNVQSNSTCIQKSHNQIKNYNNSRYENPSFVSDNSENINFDDIELESLQENQEIHSLNVSENITVNSDKDIDLCENIENSKFKPIENYITLNERTDPNTLEMSQNIESVINLKRSNCSVSNEKYEVRTSSGIILNSNDNNVNETNLRNEKFFSTRKWSSKSVRFEKPRTEKYFSNSKWSSKSVRFEREPEHTLDRGMPGRASLPLPARRPSMAPGEIFRRLSRGVYLAKKMTRPIVEGVDEERLWTEAKALNRSALLVL
ncbi:unnamed protein product, partial [Meganyctiphanes norvegica]